MHKNKIKIVLILRKKIGEFFSSTKFPILIFYPSIIVTNAFCIFTASENDAAVSRRDASIFVWEGLSISDKISTNKLQKS